MDITYIVETSLDDRYDVGVRATAGFFSKIEGSTLRFIEEDAMVYRSRKLSSKEEEELRNTPGVTDVRELLKIQNPVNRAIQNWCGRGI